MKHQVAAAAIAAIVCGDGGLKRCAQRQLADGHSKKICNGYVVLQLFHNRGAALGALEKNQKLLLAVNSGLLGAAVAELMEELDAEKSGVGHALSCCGLSFLVGGGLSNLIDRIRRGYVTDYFSLDLGDGAWQEKLRTVIFNCSDFCIFFGCLLWMIQRTSKSRP